MSTIEAEAGALKLPQTTPNAGQLMSVVSVGRGIIETEWADGGGGGGKWEDGVTPGDIHYSSGNVGIGTDSPVKPLHVEGDIRIGQNGYLAGTDDNKNSIWFRSDRLELIRTAGRPWIVCQNPLTFRNNGGGDILQIENNIGETGAFSFPQTDALEVRRGENPQSLRVYNDYTAADDFERLFCGFDTNVAYIRTEADGPGFNRDLYLSAGSSTIRLGSSVKVDSNWLEPVNDNTTDFGTPSKRYKASYVSAFHQIDPSTAPGDTTSKLYNVAGDLFWNGSQLGGGGVEFPLLAPNGSAAEPSYAFTDAPATGIYTPGSHVITTSHNGTLGWQLYSNRLIGMVSGCSVETDSLVVRQNGTTARGRFQSATWDGSYVEIRHAGPADGGSTYAMAISSGGTNLINAVSGQTLRLRVGNGDKLVCDGTQITTYANLLPVNDGGLDLGTDSNKWRNVLQTGYHQLDPSTAPGDTTSKLYNIAGTLTWNGGPVLAGAVVEAQFTKLLAMKAIWDALGPDSEVFLSDPTITVPQLIAYVKQVAQAVVDISNL